MRYASIRSLDVSNGEGVGASLFVQGCPIRCFNCFNKETWDFNGGKKWTEETKNKFMELVDKPFIKRVSILGGEPLADGNCLAVRLLCKEIKTKFPDKKIWIYSGYDFRYLSREQIETILFSDVMVDGRYIDAKKDMTLKFRGSKNQRIIDVQKSLREDKIILYCD